MTTESIERPTIPSRRDVDTSVKPVMLLTLNVRFDDEAVAVAIDAAAETGAELWICDAMSLAPTYVACSARSWAERDNIPHLATVARTARSRGVAVSQVAFHNPKPIRAAIEVCRTEQIGLLVFGPDRTMLSRWTFRRAVKRLRDEATCLVWTNER